MKADRIQWVSDAAQAASDALDRAAAQAEVACRPLLEKAAEKVAAESAGLTFWKVGVVSGMYAVYFTDGKAQYIQSLDPVRGRTVHDLALVLLDVIVPVEAEMEAFLDEVQECLESISDESSWASSRWVKTDYVRTLCRDRFMGALKAAVSPDLLEVAKDALAGMASIPREEILASGREAALADARAAFSNAVKVALTLMPLDEALSVVREEAVSSVMES